MQAKATPSQHDLLAAFLKGYVPGRGVPDELLDAAGQVRPVWAGFIRQLAAMRPEELSARLARGDQYLRDAGVYHRQYGAGGSAERDWPLSHVPVLMDESEWQAIGQGLIQRADLLEEVVADLYGANRLVADGLLPAALVAENPEWLRPLVGVKPRSGHFLHFLAFDIGRGPGESWWVLGDRTQAPSGAGFALENRIATARVFSDTYASAHVHRLAGFFRSFRDTMLGLRGAEGGGIGILSPGQMNDTYFEHAYIARYLGFMLLEGEDLAVRDGQVMVRTVSGLQPISVLWRRLDAAWADPLELNEGSRLGTPGLVGTVRAGGVSMVNALGSGVLEARAFLAFLPRICEALRGEPLLLPNIATWWCGQEAEGAHVKANAARMTISAALSPRLPFDLADTVAVGGAFRAPVPGATLDGWIDSHGRHLVGQEAVTLSTTPALVGGNLAPRPFSLRVYLARTAQGWQVMPGGFARVGRSEDPTAVALQQGGSVADVWVVSPSPVSTETMITAPNVASLRREPGILPSRAADNLYWLGRYVERAETSVRMLRAWHVRMAESAAPDTPLLQYLAEHVTMRGLDLMAGGVPQGLRDTLGLAVASAGHVRDRFSVDGWAALNDLAETAAQMAPHLQAGDDSARAMGVLLRKITGFSGLVHENMYRTLGWRFLSIGRALERAVSMAGVLAGFAGPDAPEGAFDVAIEIGDSTMTHRSRFAVATNRTTVIELLALDGLNPRAVLYQLTRLREHVAHLPGIQEATPMSALERALVQTHTDLATDLADTLDSARLIALQGRIGEISDLLTQAYLR